MIEVAFWALVVIVVRRSYVSVMYPLPAYWIGPAKRRFSFKTLSYEWGYHAEWLSPRGRVVHSRWVWARELAKKY